MKITATTISGKTVEFNSPVKMQLCESFDTPASSLYVVFSVFEPIEELEKISMTSNSKVVFEGNVDEQKTTCNSRGIMISISARSNSKLIDNEALPTTYYRPTLNDIYKKHLQPLGILGVLGDGACQGDFSVSKGMCHWAVVEEFCKCVLNVSPRITRDGFLDARGNKKSDTKISFGNFYGSDCRFFSAQIKYKRYGVVGKFYFKSEQGQGYQNVEENKPATSRNIDTVRYLNLAGSQKWARQYKLERELKKSLAGSVEIELIVPFDCFFEVYNSASFFDQRLGRYEDMRIFEIEHIISNSGRQCRVTLRPAEHF